MALGWHSDGTRKPSAFICESVLAHLSLRVGEDQSASELNQSSIRAQSERNQSAIRAHLSLRVGKDQSSECTHARSEGMRPLGEAGEAVGEGADDLLVVPLQHEPALQDARRAHLEHRDAPLRKALIWCKPRALCVQGGSEKQGGSGQGGRQTQATGGRVRVRAWVRARAGSGVRAWVRGARASVKASSGMLNEGRQSEVLGDQGRHSEVLGDQGRHSEVLGDQGRHSEVLARAGSGSGEPLINGPHSINRSRVRVSVPEGSRMRMSSR